MISFRLMLTRIKTKPHLGKAEANYCPIRTTTKGINKGKDKNNDSDCITFDTISLKVWQVAVHRVAELDTTKAS